MGDLRRVSESEMRELLREAYSRDPEKSFLAELARGFSDPAKPFDMQNRSHIHPVWLSLGLIICIALCVFVYFSLGRP